MIPSAADKLPLRVYDVGDWINLDSGERVQVFTVTQMGRGQRRDALYGFGNFNLTGREIAMNTCRQRS